MGLSYEAVVLAGDEAALLGQLEKLPDRWDALSFEAYRVSDQGFVIFAWREGLRHLGATEEVEDIARALSVEFRKALATHFDEMLQVREATLYQEGEFVRSFGEEDELWAPPSEEEHDRPQASWCPSTAIPEGAEYDFVWGGIDAGLEAAGFRSWLPTDRLVQFATTKNLIWARERTSP